MWPSTSTPREHVAYLLDAPVSQRQPHQQRDQCAPEEERRAVGPDRVVAAAYVPSLVEIAVALGIIGYALLAYTLGVRYLPLFPIDDIEHG